MPKVSVVVPVYNVEAYLEKCVSSVLHQTESDFELLLIDDGSTDGSGALCDRLAAQDPRVRVIHQENRGLGGARNTGIEAAAGQWLFFVDSDDWIQPDALEQTLRIGEAAGAELIIFGFRTVTEQGQEIRRVTEALPKGQGLTLAGQKELLLAAPSACNKLFRAELFARTGVRFPPRVWYEDLRTTPKLMTAAKRVVVTDYVGYHYLQRESSITRNINIQRNREIFDALDDLIGWFRAEGLYDDYRDELCHLALYHAYLTASVRVIRIDRKSGMIPEFAAFLRERFPNYRQDPYFFRLTGNERLLFSLLEKKWYWAIALIFKIKG